MTDDPGRKVRLADGTFIPLPVTAEGALPPRPAAAISLRHFEREDLSTERVSTGASRSRWSITARRSILIIGAGSVGSHAAIVLAQLGFSLIVIDRDTVERSNVEGGRSALLPETIGMPKPAALAYTIQRLGLQNEVVPLGRAVQEFTDVELRSLAMQSVGVLASFDEPVQLLRVNGVLFASSVVVYPSFHTGARTASLVWTAPGRGMPCCACSMGVRTADELRQLHGEPAFPPDVRRIADAAARVLYSLCADDDANAAGLVDPQRNVIFLHNRPAATPERSLAVQFIQTDRDPECPVCSGNREGR